MDDALEVAVHVADGVEAHCDAGRIERAVRHVLAAEGVAEAELSVTLLDDAAIGRLNRQYLAHEGPTDVISFPLHRPGQPVLGDIYIGAEQARRQAREHGEAPDVEVLRLAIHGTLHVLGYEHPEDATRESAPMYSRQEELLAGFLGEPPGASVVP